MSVILRGMSAMADKINQHHLAATKSAESAIESAKRCGECLLEAKQALPHGEFRAWLEKYCRVKARQATSYMKLARNWDQISKTAPTADLTIDGALSLIRPAQRPYQQTWGDALCVAMVVDRITAATVAQYLDWHSLGVKDLLQGNDGSKLAEGETRMVLRHHRKAAKLLKKSLVHANEGNNFMAASYANCAMRLLRQQSPVVIDNHAGESDE